MISVFQSCSVLAQTSRVYNKPNASKIYTSDIDNFYKAFDLALNDTDNAKKIFKKEYFSKGTKVLKIFIKLKLMTMKNLQSLSLNIKTSTHQ